MSQAAKIIVKSGDVFPITGYYKYDHHEDDEITNCFIPQQTQNSLFKAGEIAPKLGSCTHSIFWMLMRRY